MIANRHGRTSLSLSLFSPAFLLGSLWGSSRPRGDVTSTVAQLAKRKKRASSTSSRLLRGVFLRNVAVSSRIVGRISRISTVYPLPREFVVLFYPRPSRKRCITRLDFFFFTYPQDPGALQESQASLPNARRRYLARSRPRSLLAIPLFSFSLLFSFPRILSRSSVVGGEEGRKSARDSV